MAWSKSSYTTYTTSSTTSYFQSRVSDCQNRVKDLIDLNLCSDGVKSALAEEDYEQAAAHLHRFLAMDVGLLKLTASEMQAEYLTCDRVVCKVCHSQGCPEHFPHLSSPSIQFGLRHGSAGKYWLDEEIHELLCLGHP